MYIDRLHLRAFGKFVHKRIFFSRKFNIIYGENEAGKSTIHNFIEAMMYGFDDTDKFNKYKPWNSSMYKGTVEISDGENNNLIVRDFLLNTLQIFKMSNDENTLIENVEVPGEYFFNINKISFKNTVSISQLGNKTEKELAGELKKKIINLSNTKDEKVSIDRIMYRLHSIKEEAGREDDGKTLLGQYALRLSQLKEARENSLNAKRQVMFLAMERKKLQSKIYEISRHIEVMEKEISQYELSLEKQRYLKALPVKKEIDELNAKIKSIEAEIINCSKEDYNEAAEIENSLYSMKNDRERLLEEVEECKLQLETLCTDLANKIPDDFEIDKLNLDYDIYIRNNEKINSLRKKIQSGKDSIASINLEEIDKFINDYKKAEDISRKIEINNVLTDNGNYELMKKFGKSNRIRSVLTGFLGTIFVLAGAASAYGGYYYGNINYYYGGVALLPGVISYVFSWKCRNRALSAKKEIESMECEFADYSLSNKKLLEEKEEIIKRNGFEKFDTMSKTYEKKCEEKLHYEEKVKLINYDENKINEISEENKEIEKKLKKRLNALNLQLSQENITAIKEAYKRKDKVKEEVSKIKNKIDGINNDITKLNKEISYEEKRLAMILASNGMESVESFKEGVEINEKYRELTERREYCRNILDNIIGDVDFYELKNRTKNIPDEVKEIDKKDIQLNIFKLNEERNKYLNHINDIHREIEDIEESTRGLAEIEEEIDFYEEKISSIKNRIKIAEIAEEKITKISDSIKGDFMPLLRKSISDNFSYLTGEKYTQVVIDEDMNIAVMSKEEGDRKIDLENLSGGTLDQLYLSLRIALSNILSGNQNIPLIFDDSFVQYDSNRLRKSIEMLARESERRQVILFTCQNREAELAKEMNIKFNYIKL